MAKTIKFNLLLDDNPVRDIKSLQNNFCIDDILEVYENGLLQKWLKVRGFDEYLEKVENIQKESSIIVELIKIFDIQKDDAEIRESIYSLEFQESRKKSLEIFDMKDEHLKNRITEYHKNYEKLIEDIIEYKEDMAFLKIASKEISDKYLKLFELDYKDSYELYKEKSPFMIYAVLMNDALHIKFMDSEYIKKDLYENFISSNETCSRLKSLNLKIDTQLITDVEVNTNGYYLVSGGEPILIVKFNNQDENKLYVNGINYHPFEKLEFIKLKTIAKELGLIYFKDVTDSYWKDLETADTKVMILSIPDGTFIRSANDLKQELSAEEINGNFLILNGLAYKSNTDSESIVYMKV